MNVHYFQHVPFEDLGCIEHWLKRNFAKISATKFYENAYLPEVQDIDWLIVMGGPMSVNDELIYPWLQAEKNFVTEAITKGKIVLGICLGAQMIASALGARVYKNQNTEIGWFPIERLEHHVNSKLINLLPSKTEVFHWHGETFDLPAGAVHIARSEGCNNQAFCIGDRVLGLQFHLEITPAIVRSLIEHCPNDLTSGKYIQSEADIMAPPPRFERINFVMDALLDYWNEKEFV